MPGANKHIDIVERLNNGQPQALEELFAQYYRPLVYFALRIIKSQEDAEDVVIETFSKLWDNREKMEGLRNVKGFLYLTTRNSCIDVLRAQKKMMEVKGDLHALAEPDLPSIETETTRAEILRQIGEEMEKLPKQCRNVFTLSVIQGLKSKDIANQLNISISNVTSQKSRAVRLLRTALMKRVLHFFVGMM